MFHHPKIKIPSSFRSLIAGIEIELFVAGVLAIVLGLACVRAFLPESVLSGVGFVSFVAFVLAGASAMRVARRARQVQPFLWGVTAALAIVWIAAGRLAGAGYQDRLLPF